MIVFLFYLIIVVHCWKTSSSTEVWLNHRQKTSVPCWCTVCSHNIFFSFYLFSLKQLHWSVSLCNFSGQTFQAIPPTRLQKNTNYWKTYWETSTSAPPSPLRWSASASRKSVSCILPDEGKACDQKVNSTFSCSECSLVTPLPVHSFVWGVAPAGRVQAAAAHRAPPVGKAVRRWGGNTTTPAWHGQWPGPVVHV